jgi:hypothetical protein
MDIGVVNVFSGTAVALLPFIAFKIKTWVRYRSKMTEKGLSLGADQKMIYRYVE